MWEKKKPICGDQIRVNRGFYYHHGIYIDDDNVIHFASPTGSEISPETAVVHKTTLRGFLKDGEVEVRCYTDEELKRRRPVSDIINYAILHQGEKGYNLVYNNCEHFSNRCAFGVSESDQVNNVFSSLGALFGSDKR